MPKQVTMRDNKPGQKTLNEKLQAARALSSSKKVDVDFLHGKIVNCERVNLREQASKDSTVITTLPLGELVMVDVDFESKDWSHIQVYNNSSQVGYVMRQFVEVE